MRLAAAPGAVRKCLPGLARLCRLSTVMYREICRLPGEDIQKKSELHSKEATLYVHWPYCLRRCSYCNFNKYISRSVNHVDMATCLQRETETLLRLSQVSSVASVFFGGGTPSLAPPSTIAAVLETVAKHAGLRADAEVTLEVNPTPFGMAKLADFRHAGVNRYSVGVQSLHDEDLRVLGRDHDSQHALRTVEEARRLCPGRVSVDVIFGRPGQSLDHWEAELEELLLVCDDHVSLYQLTLERGTHLFKQVQAGQLSLPGDEVMARMYESARRILQERGFLQYEVSNFARNGAVSSHNLAYWRAGEFLGVGPGAHGRFVPREKGGVFREARTQTLEPDVWMSEVKRWGHATRRRVELGHVELLEEVLVMGLRLTEGISHQHWGLFSPGLDLQQVVGESTEVKELQEQGLLILDHRGLRCSWEGLAVLDSLLPPLLLGLQAHGHTAGLRGEHTTGLE
ncbi:radical S-adenosyl methionine domain-containing protein 1, mitochondrial [Conger conger]|uniref:radical S-adenosyl methionine domain-containing protein 1, mitochondrial n=1 Tax=Conger conger TaxID=82655 RepID=UPI002A59FF08|nr:radical S-adenosyl methionine domain-containing protein 1, mitochondrial [Conger conger]